MSLYRFPTLTCDGCGEIHDPGRQMSASEIRRDAKRRGWTYRTMQDDYLREDLCARCVHKPECSGNLRQCTHYSHRTAMQ